MTELKNRSPHGSKKGGEQGEFDTLSRRVHFCMLFLAWEMHLFFSAFSHKNNIRSPPDVLHFKKTRNGGHLNVRMDKNTGKRFL